MEKEYKKHTREEFLGKLESLTSKLDRMIEVAKPDDAAWISSAIETGIKLLAKLGEIVVAVAPVLIKLAAAFSQINLG